MASDHSLPPTESQNGNSTEDTLTPVTDSSTTSRKRKATPSDTATSQSTTSKRSKDCNDAGADSVVKRSKSTSTTFTDTQAFCTINLNIPIESIKTVITDLLVNKNVIFNVHTEFDNLLTRDKQ